MQQARVIPLWIKIVWSAFVAVLIPVYWIHYGPANFLWFSDIALFGGLLAAWIEHALLASTMALIVVLFEIVWNLDFFAGLVLGDAPLGLAGYMWDDSIPLVVRLISLFHVPLPIALVWMVWRLGYDRRALLAATVLAWIVLPVTFFSTDPEENINWVHGGPAGAPQTIMPPLLWVAMLMLAFPLLAYLPSHLVLHWLFARTR